MNINGSIPKKITYFFLPEKEVCGGVEWNLGVLSSREKVLPAAAADASDLQNVKNAQFSLRNFKKIIPKSIEVENLPIKNIKLFCLSRKYSSGLQYKILIKDYLLDLKEDVLLDALIKEGTTNGGILNGEYIWAKIGSYTKLIRIGSDLHNMIIASDKRKNMQIIPKKKLEPGGVYQNKKGQLSIYLGPVNTVRYTPSQVKKFQFNQHIVKNHMLFCSIYSHDSSIKIKNTFLNSPDNCRFVIRKDHNFIEKVDYISIPSDAVDKVRKIFIKKIKQNIVDYSNKNKSTYPMMSSNYLEYLFLSLSKLLNVYQVGSKPVDIFDINQYLAFS